ncbi:hypothetical protein M8C21_010748 [Ambrosia artemisiifolia]|uniref:Uncharacterized protein n=1 Tax=Ambrosia artemisiifolia TaxID=4212 RepID=A0AAD5GEJ1_AMBAR|nr:hypothetical protein M8C21_010748 [Ambrosia artemisiifolia]
MFTTAVKYVGTKPKPAMKALEPIFRPEQNQTITRAIFEIVKEHGPLTVAQTWERVQEVGVKDLTSKTQMKSVLRWMKERQKLKQICNHVGPNKQFLYTTWFTKPPTVAQPRSGGVKSSQRKAT